MEKKRGKKRNRERRLWGFLGALWLVAVCLLGCGAVQKDGESTAKDSRTVQTAEETAVREIETEETVQTEAVKTDIWTEEDGDSKIAETDIEGIEESGSYTSKDEVALYLHTYGRLPENYITKRDAEALGWDSKEGNLWEVAPGMSIGGSRFGNYEGALPDAEGRKYYECDIDYEGGYRGAKRLIYSSDGLIFYTEDHYNTFEQLYGE